jgi:roadblock/LC7 domain-containing protein
MRVEGTMSDLDKLMSLSGAVAAGEFTKDGRLAGFKGDMDPKWTHMLANMCAANTLMGTMQCEAFSTYTGMKMAPFYGWAMSAGDYSICVMGHRGVMMATAKADFNAAFAALAELRGVVVDSKPILAT